MTSWIATFALVGGCSFTSDLPVNDELDPDDFDAAPAAPDVAPPMWMVVETIGPYNAPAYSHSIVPGGLLVMS